MPRSLANRFSLPLFGLALIVTRGVGPLEKPISTPGSPTPKPQSLLPTRPCLLPGNLQAHKNFGDLYFFSLYCPFRMYHVDIKSTGFEALVYI